MDIDALSTLIGEDLAAANYADIWVSVPDASALALLGEARRLADALGCYVHAVVAPTGLVDHAIACGADRVHQTADTAAFLRTQHPEFAFFPVSQTAEAAQAAQRHRAGLITDAHHLNVDDSTRALLGAHPVYGGEYRLDYAVTSTAKFATLDPRSLPEPYADPSRSGEVVTDDFSAPQAPVQDHGPVDYAPQPWRPLQKARVIISAGRGLQDAAGFTLIQQLAEKLGPGAEVGGDRSAQELGWIDEARVVGVTGQEVAPDLYIAVGIRGDTVHNAAIARARHIIAIHANPAAPLLAIADEAVVGDPKEVLTQLLTHFS